MASPSTEKYIENLTFALRMRNVPGEKIGQIVAEVEAHVAECGEDPVDAFGKPREYANAWARDAGQSTDWPKRIRYGLGVAGSGAGGFFAALGGIRTITGETLWGLHSLVALLAGAILLAVSALTLPREHKIVDPRTGREHERVRRAGRRALLIVGAAVLSFVVFAIIVNVTLD